MFNLDPFFDWDKPAYSFSRPVHDMKPYSIKTLEDMVVLVHSIVGVKEDDIKVDIVNENGRDRLVIEGVTHNDVLNYDYKVSSKFDIKADMFKSVKYEVKDGLLYIYLYKKEPEVTKLSVTRI